MMARSLKFWSSDVQGLFYLHVMKEDADQLCGFCAADLHLCFCIYMQKAGFLILEINFCQFSIKIHVMGGHENNLL